MRKTKTAVSKQRMPVILLSRAALDLKRVAADQCDCEVRRVKAPISYKDAHTNAEAHSVAVDPNVPSVSYVGEKEPLADCAGDRKKFNPYMGYPASDKQLDWFRERMKNSFPERFIGSI